VPWQVLNDVEFSICTRKFIQFLEWKGGSVDEQHHDQDAGARSLLPRQKACLLPNMCRVNASLDAKLFQMQSAPLLIPPGDWEEIKGSITAPKGFQASGVYAGMRSGKKADLALVVCSEGAVAAGTFTQNVMCAAPVTLCKEVLAANTRSIKAVRPTNPIVCYMNQTLQICTTQVDFLILVCVQLCTKARAFSLRARWIHCFCASPVLGRCFCWMH
jgi:hypothetical protein